MNATINNQVYAGKPECATVAAALRQIAAALTATSPSPVVDAEVLVMHACVLERSGLIARAGTALTRKQQLRLQTLLARRQAGEPISYITGTREFWSLRLQVSPATLIPRPETELLVEQALARIPMAATWTLVDLGTGSGAVAVALANERRQCRVIACDTSKDAIVTARKNAMQHNLERIEFHLGEWFAPLADYKFNMIVSNPPYICDDDPHLNRGDLRYEPLSALTSGPDGLDAIRHIAAHAPHYLLSGGWLLLEHGLEQGQAVKNILSHNGYRDISSAQDLAGHDRVCVGRWP